MKKKTRPQEFGPGDRVRTSPEVGVGDATVLEIVSRRGRGRYKVRFETPPALAGTVFILAGQDLDLLVRSTWEGAKS